MVLGIEQRAKIEEKFTKVNPREYEIAFPGYNRLPNPSSRILIICKSGHVLYGKSAQELNDALKFHQMICQSEVGAVHL